MEDDDTRYFARVSVSTVERIERGERVSDDALDRIAQAFGYEAGYFTAARLPLGADEAAASLLDTYSHLEIVPVAPDDDAPRGSRRGAM